MLQPPICASGKRSLAPGLARNYKPQHDLRLHAGITEGGIRGKMSALQSSIGNQALLRMIDNSAPVPQTQLAMNRPGDVFEQEANRVADHVMSATTSLMVQHRDLSAGGTVRRKCAECAEEEKLKRKPAGSRPVSAVPPIVHDVLRSPGRPLEGSTRNYMESRFQTDFSGVRIHTDDHASRSARAVNALAYTVGRNVVFGAGQYQPASSGGMRLLAHELAHVVQQSTATHAPGLQRQLVTPLAAGGGFGGLMERDRRAVSALTVSGAAASPVQVCSRPLQSALGLLFNHAYIDAPPQRYAVISPLCKATDGKPDNVLQGTVGQKWDNSPDPCKQSPVNCVQCRPRPGVADVNLCLRNTFLGYNNPNLYKGLGPNSNTFAGTLARACCDGMIPQPPALGSMPGWNDFPAPPRAGICPPGPTC